MATLLKQHGSELHMAAPNKIPKPPVKTDKRDAVRLGHLYQSDSMPECYISPPEVDYLRLLTRKRKDLAIKVTLVKKQFQALVSRNLLDSELKGVSDWFGVVGLTKLVRLDLPSAERSNLARYLEQLELLAKQEESMQSGLAKIASTRSEIQNLMTIPGVGFYSAVGNLGGDWGYQAVPEQGALGLLRRPGLEGRQQRRPRERRAAREEGEHDAEVEQKDGGDRVLREEGKVSASTEGTGGRSPEALRGDLEDVDVQRTLPG